MKNPLRNSVLVYAQILAFAFASVSTASAQLDFDTTLYATAGNGPYAVASGDLNEDGELDIISGNQNGGNLSIFFGDGDGELLPPVSIPVGTVVTSVVAVDWNKDMHLDLVASSFGDGKVRFYQGNGAGIFAMPTEVNAVGVVKLVAADFNGDGNVDLALAQNTANQVLICFGDGMGGIASNASYAVGNLPGALAANDLDGDMDIDLIAVNSNSDNFSVLLNNGGGTFAAAVNYSTGSSPIDIAVGDFTGDMLLDAAVANFGDNSVSIFPGTGTGTFGSAVSLPVAASPNGIATADFDDDNKLDLAVAVATMAGNIQVFVGQGTGAFSNAVLFAAAQTPTQLITPDVDDDGTADIVSANADGNSIAVLLNMTQPFVDNDGDGINDSVDSDDDNDGSSDVQEQLDQTDPLNPGSYLEHNFGGEYCLEWNGYLSFLSQVIELRNVTQQSSTIRLDLRGIDGSVLSSTNFTLAGGAQRDLVINALSGFSPQTYGLVCAVVTSGSPDGLDAQFAAYVATPTTFNYAFGIRYQPPDSGRQSVSYNHIFPTLNFYELTNFAAGYVQVSNESATTESGNLIFYSAEGGVVKTIPVTLASHARRDFDTHSIGANTVGLVVWQPTDADSRFRVTLNRYYYSFSGALSGATSLPAQRALQVRRAIAFDTRDRVAVVEISNPTAQSVDVQISTVDQSGVLTPQQPGSIPNLLFLPAHGTRHVVLNNYLPDGLGQAFLEGESELSDFFTANSLEYGFYQSLQFRFASASKPQSGFGAEQRFSYNTFLGDCRVRFSNQTATSKDARYSVTRYDGTVLASNVLVTLAGGATTEVDVCQVETQPAYGEVEITQQSPLTIVTETVRTNADDTAELRMTSRDRAAPISSFTVGGTISGLSGTIVIENNGEDALSPSTDGPFTFPTPVAQGMPYEVTIRTQPAGQTCSITNGSGTMGGANVTNVSVTCAANTYTVGGSISGLSGTVTLQNNGADNLSTPSNGSFTFSTPVAEGASYNVTVLTQPSGQTCSVTNGSGTMGGANVTNVSVTCAVEMTTLTTSVSDLALSITGYTEFGVAGTPSSGVARVISITNTGSNSAMDLNVSTPTWPSGTTSMTSCGATLASGASCTITVTPGSTATSDGTNPSTVGTAPVPGVVSVSSSNANTVNTNVVVIGYGTIWQGGHIFALDDSTPNTGSVGGKVLTTSDQASTLPNGIVWSSDDSGSAVFDLIYGVSEVSTSSTADPSTGQVSGQLACNGNVDGFCNTNNIYTYYQNNATNAPINANFYASGLCKATIGSYSDWYLPAICELGFDAGASGTGCGTSASPTLQNVQSNLVDGGGLNLVSSFYWSSTEVSALPQPRSWYQDFAAGSSQQADTLKIQRLGVRCARNLTL